MATSSEMEISAQAVIRSDPEDEAEKPQIPSILDSISQDQINEFKPFHVRYFEEKYCTKFTTDAVNLDTCIRVHSNKICVVFVSPKHSVIQKGQRLKRLNFHVSAKVNRLCNSMSGKGKRGAQLLQPQSILCYMETEDDEKYPIHCGIYGKLLEINDRVVENPNLILDDLCEGFLAIILPDIRKHEENMKSLLSAQEYNF